MPDAAGGATVTDITVECRPVLALSEIDVTGRSRKSMGDIPALAASIERLGLLHPVVVTPNNKLIVGRRRIEAFKKLGRAEIPVNVARNLGELQLLLEAERDENSCRENYTPEEAVHLARRFEPVARELAKRAQQEGAKRGGSTSPKAKVRETFPKVKDDSKRTRAQSAAVVGLSDRTLERAATVVDSGDRALIDEMNRTGKVSGVFKKLVVREKAAGIAKEPPPLPTGKFRVIVADPPWRYDNRAEDPSHRGALPYPSMSLDEIARLDVGSRACPDSILWLWTTNAHLPHAFGIAEKWGFQYKTMLTWVKTTMGTGDWLRGKTEHCLMNVRGQPTIVLTNQTTVIVAEKGAHSSKPAAFYNLVEALCPGSKLELFQRTPRKGWIGHGDESAAGSTGSGGADA